MLYSLIATAAVIIENQIGIYQHIKNILRQETDAFTYFISNWKKLCDL